MEGRERTLCWLAGPKFVARAARPGHFRSSAHLSRRPPPAGLPLFLCRYTEQQKPRVLISLAAVGLFMAVGWPLIVYNAGWWGLVKYWLMPWLGYHFWMSECLPACCCWAAGRLDWAVLAAAAASAVAGCCCCFVWTAVFFIFWLSTRPHVPAHPSLSPAQAPSRWSTTPRPTSPSSPPASGTPPRRRCRAPCTATTPG